jgi:hypothetical protein
MVKTRSGKITRIYTSVPNKKTNKVKCKRTRIYITKTKPITVSLTPRNKNDIPYNSYPFVISPGKILYVVAQKYCNAKWYHDGKVIKSWIYDVFLTKDESNNFIKNYRCGEDKWIEESKIIEIALQE